MIQLQKIVKQHADKKKELLQLTVEQRTVLKEFQEFDIEDGDDFQLASEYLIELKTLMKKMEAGRKKFLAPFNEMISEFREWYSPIMKAFTETEKLLKGKVGEFQTKEEEKQIQAMLEASSAAQAGDFMGAHEATKKIVPLSKAKGVSIGKKVTYELVDLRKVPAEWTLTVLNEKKVEEYCKAAGTLLPEPVSGLKFTIEVPVRVRSRKGA